MRLHNTQTEEGRRAEGSTRQRTRACCKRRLGASLNEGAAAHKTQRHETSRFFLSRVFRLCSPVHAGARERRALARASAARTRQRKFRAAAPAATAVGCADERKKGPERVQTILLGENSAASCSLSILTSFLALSPFPSPQKQIHRSPRKASPAALLPYLIFHFIFLFPFRTRCILIFVFCEFSEKNQTILLID